VLVPRPPRPDDLYRLRIPTEPRLSPDGRLAVVTLQTVAPGFDGYRHALWLVPTDGSAPPRQLTIGARHDRQPRFSPDGRTLAFISDRRAYVEEEPTARRGRDRAAAVGDTRPDREDRDQIHLLSLDGGEARRLTDLPRGVDAFEWSPDGSRLVVVSSSHGSTREEDDRARGISRTARNGDPPESDYRFIDRLEYMLNGKGFMYDRVGRLWLVDAATGAADRLTEAESLMPDVEPAWSPDGSRIAFIANRRRNADIGRDSDLHVVDVATRAVRRVSGGGRASFQGPAWLPDGRTIAVLGHRYEARAGTRNDIWLFGADGSDAGPRGGRNLSASHDLMPGSGMSSDITPGEPAVLAPSADGRWIAFTAPVAGSYELWRIRIDDGRVERLTEGRHYVSGWSAAVGGSTGRGMRIAYLRSTASSPADLWVLDVGARDAGAPRRLTAFNAEVLDELELHEPVERHVTVDGRDIQGWFLPASGSEGKAAPLVLQIHGGPHTLYGWSPLWEFQVLAAAGIGVFFCNPRGSEGYGQAFNDANHRDWGPGPMRDVLAGVDALVEDGLADPQRLGVTGGSYGGYLTNWIVGHDDRFRAAMTCRSVSDMGTLFIVGDLSGGEWPKLELDVRPWEDPAYYREISPISYADRIHTPLLIQHSERDLRTTIVQAEALFTVLRSLRRPVRLLRVPEETHELTRSGTPFRRVENLRIVESWFRHFLIDGKRGLPPLPRIRGGR
jgi:acylaminoacyl-peptidase